MQYVETPYNNGGGFPSCAAQCLRSYSMESQGIIFLNETGGLIMATHTLEEMLSHSAAARLQEQNVGNNDVVRAAA